MIMSTNTCCSSAYILVVVQAPWHPELTTKVTVEKNLKLMCITNRRLHTWSDHKSSQTVSSTWVSNKDDITYGLLNFPWIYKVLFTYRPFTQLGIYLHQCAHIPYVQTFIQQCSNSLSEFHLIIPTLLEYEIEKRIDWSHIK